MILDHRGDPVQKHGLGFVPTQPAKTKPQLKTGSGTADAIGFMIWPSALDEIEEATDAD